MTYNNEIRPKTNRENETLERQSIDHRLTNDNAFSDQGLNNARDYEETVKDNHS